MTIDRHGRLTGAAAKSAARAIVTVLIDAFEVEPERSASLEAETIEALANPWFTYHLARVGSIPAAVARAATFEGATYLSSIGTAGWARHRGLAQLVTASAVVGALRTGSEWTHLGVFADNVPAIRLYERLGFERVGDSSPDLLLV